MNNATISKLKNIEARMRILAEDIRATKNLSETEYDAQTADKIADRVREIYIKGSGTGKD